MRRVFVFGLLLMGLAAGCQHYRVTDPQTGQTYYTRTINRHLGGAVSFEDQRTHDKVTLQNSQVEKISEDAYDAGIRVPPPPPRPILVP